jgi:hypothetical protein
MTFVPVPDDEVSELLAAVERGDCCVCYGPVSNGCGGDHDLYCHACDEECVQGGDDRAPSTSDDFGIVCSGEAHVYNVEAEPGDSCLCGKRCWPSDQIRWRAYPGVRSPCVVAVHEKSCSVECLQDPPPTPRELADDLLERINRACPEGTGIERENWNRAGRAIEAWLEERGLGRRT